MTNQVNQSELTTMKTTRTRNLITAVLVGALAITSVPTAQAQISRFNELANLPFKENRPTEQTARTLRDELLFQRATQTYLWALPLINTLGMQVGSEKQFGAGYNVLPHLEKAPRCQDAHHHAQLRPPLRDELR